MKKIILIGLPASGKSEVRRYLASLSHEDRHRIFGLRPFIHLDDYPYVAAARKIDEELIDMGQPPIIFKDPRDRFRNQFEWYRLVHFLNQDFHALTNWEGEYTYSDYALEDGTCTDYSRWLFERFDRLAVLSGAPHLFCRLSEEVLSELAERCQDMAQTIYESLYDKRVGDLDSYTVIIELSRGGGKDAVLPLDPPQGYEASFHQFHTDLLEDAAVVYVKVSVAESIRKDQNRGSDAAKEEADPELFHHLPDSVRKWDYSRCDLEYIADADDHGRLTIYVESDGRPFDLPLVILDNEADLTSFIRDGDASTWPADKVEALQTALQECFQPLVA